MEELPEELTPTQQEAQHVLQCTLTKLLDPRSKYCSRYSRWIQRHTNLAEFCFRCIRPQVWEALQQGLNYDSVKAIAGEFDWQTRGVYYDVVMGKVDCLTRLYIGQSTNLRVRIRQHTDFRYRRDAPSLHYHALQKSKGNPFGVLCTLPSPTMGNHMLPGMDEPDLLLNLLEMWMCLVFRCLPKQTLQEWLPSGVETGGEIGSLNIQCPLDTWEGPGGKHERVDLRNAEDPLAREWAEMKRAEWQGTQTKAKDTSPVAETRPFPVLPLLSGFVVGFLLCSYLKYGKGR
ncbi:hypothetical protein BU23DRAFT_538232 [Bimuria novae-zelandiae CBS 107.79]|uniref:GIY-YIG domain-containing protein n=1 Tax=Bimuria novae-zelandiae CBS 107.79 TaxID=1447943 RepID=A0A6A5V2J5_9PLEO|nr:hypothetical protein BU23DRAFT_538232 [Bimuria novae-zelandiae CBS 107.79]